MIATIKECIKTVPGITQQEIESRLAILSQDLGIEFEKYFLTLRQSQISKLIRQNNSDISRSRQKGLSSIAFAVHYMLTIEDKGESLDSKTKKEFIETLESFYIFRKYLEKDKIHKAGEKVWPHFPSSANIDREDVADMKGSAQEKLENRINVYMEDAALSNMMGINLIGGTKTGKTYLMNYAYEFLYSDVPLAIPIYIDMSKKLKSIQDFYKNITNLISSKIDEFIDMSACSYKDDFADFLLLVAQKLDNYRLFLLIDEVSSDNIKIFNELFINMHAYYNIADDNIEKISYMVAFNPIDMKSTNLTHSSSSLIRIGSTLNTQRLTLKQLMHMSSQRIKGNKYDVKELETLLGRHPYLSDLYLENLDNNNSTVNKIKNIIGKYFAAIGRHAAFLSGDLGAKKRVAYVSDYLMGEYREFEKPIPIKFYGSMFENQYKMYGNTIKKFSLNSSIKPDKNIYLEREVDATLRRALVDKNHCNLHGGRQCGKTSLMRILSNDLREMSYDVFDFEFTRFFISEQPFIYGLNKMIEKLRELSPLFSQNFSPKDNSIMETAYSMMNALSKTLKKGETLYLFFDEFDRLMVFQFNELSEFLFGLRNYINDDNENNVILLIVSVLTPLQLLENVDRSRRDGITINSFADHNLNNFSLNDRDVLDQLHSKAFPDMKEKDARKLGKDLLEFSGGQPYILSRIGYELQSVKPHERSEKLESIKESIIGNLGENHIIIGHLEGISAQIKAIQSNSMIVLDVLEKIIEGQELSNIEEKRYVPYLTNIAIVSKVSSKYQLSNQIYKKYISKDWIKSLKNELLDSRSSIAPAPKQKNKNTNLSKKIAVLYCGGTIGMTTVGDQASFDNNNAYSQVSKLLEDIEPEVDADIHMSKLMEKDGINITPEDWTIFAAYIEKNYDKYDGFIFLHGTDTLAYSASAVSFMLGANLSKPVIFTGSQTTIDVIHGDARINITRACYAIVDEKAIPEVQVLFNDTIIRAVRAEKVDDRLYSAFKSSSYPVLANITDRLLVNEHVVNREKNNKHLKLMPYHNDNILVITLMPGINSAQYEGMVGASLYQGNPVAGVMITTPGAGSIPTIDKYNFRPFIEKMTKESRIPVIIVSQMPISPYTLDQYEVAAIPHKMGAISAGNITITAAYTKFSWVLGVVQDELSKGEIDVGQKLDKIKEMMQADYVGETKVLQV